MSEPPIRWPIAILKWILQATPYEVRRRRETKLMPEISLEPLQLALASRQARGEKLTIVQVGACDGITNDPIRPYLETHAGAVRAILIEPNPLALARLQKTYAGASDITFVPAAIAEQDGERFLYRIKESVRPEGETDITLQLASFYEEHILKNGYTAEQVERITVPCRSLASLMAEHQLAQVDLLQIDAEGFDAAVVRMALQLPVLPACIHFEHAHVPDAERAELYALLEKNYLLWHDAWNMLAVQKSVLKR